MTSPSVPEAPAASPYGIVLAQVDVSYWMLAGEDHLNNLLSGEGDYPTPVHCLCFASVPELESMLAEDQKTGSLWSIHPGIIGRLQRREQLVLIEASGLSPEASPTT